MATGKQPAGSPFRKPASNAPVVTKTERRSREVLAVFDRRSAEAAGNGKKLKILSVVGEIERKNEQNSGTPQFENRQWQGEFSRTDHAIVNSGHDPFNNDKGDW